MGEAVCSISLSDTKVACRVGHCNTKEETEFDCKRKRCTLKALLLARFSKRRLLSPTVFCSIIRETNSCYVNIRVNFFNGFAITSEQEIK